MLFQSIRSLLLGQSVDPLYLLINACTALFVVFCTMPIHEFAHAYVAHLLGDDTGRLSGRMSLNPLAHIDWMGALFLVLFGFGFAKPVPVNPRNFKNSKRDMALTALAGPLSNILMAFIFLFVGALIYKIMGASAAAEAILLFFSLAATVNVNLAVFNLLPIPPLDGSKILAVILPSKAYYKIMQYNRYFIIAVFALIFLGSRLLETFSQLVLSGLMGIVNIIL